MSHSEPFFTSPDHSATVADAGDPSETSSEYSGNSNSQQTRH